MVSVNMCSTWCLQTWMQPSWCCKENRDLSENTTSHHFCWTHHWRCFYFWCNVKGSRSHGQRAGILYYCKCHRTVCADIYLSCKRSCILIEDSWHGWTIYLGQASKTSVFSAHYDSGPLRSSTPFHMTFLNSSIPYSEDSHGTSIDTNRNTAIW